MKDNTPTTVIVVIIGEMYFQCTTANMRSKIWNGEDESAKVPSAGDLIKEMKADFDGRAYDVGYAKYAKPRMW